jgi:tRNA-specific 2-thiouridylase
MSGGVDSSVAAHLLLQAGHEVIGVFMRHGEESAKACRTAPSPDGNGQGRLPVITGGVGTASATAQARADHKQGCCTASDAADARRVAAKLGIPFYALDLQADFRKIVDYFVSDYIAGRTPNPCVRCNQWIKFGRLFDFADGVDAQFVATGHYARMIDGTSGTSGTSRTSGTSGTSRTSGPQLHRGLDGLKDQSYALFGIEHHRLARMLLPVGGYSKPEIRQIATTIGLNVAQKKDSQEICFVTQGHHSDFVKAYRGEGAGATAGEFVTLDGRVVGHHAGYEAFTIGQRKGLGIALGEPHFVIRIEPDSRRVVLGPKEALDEPGLVAGEANWLVPPPPTGLPFPAQVQIRYNSPPQEATVTPTSPDGFEVRYAESQAGVAPGQAAVVFDGTRVLGGGWILSGTNRK